MINEQEMKMPSQEGEVEITSLKVNGCMVADISVYKITDGKNWITVSVFPQADYSSVDRITAKIFTDKTIKFHWVKPKDDKKFKVWSVSEHKEKV